MHSGAALPCVSPQTPMPQVIHEMSHKKLGMTTVLGALDSPSSGTDKGSDCIEAATIRATIPTTTPRLLLGMISDGDLRRLLERDGPEALVHTAAEIMNPHPITIAPEAFASEALALMEDRKITCLIVTGENGEALGVIHLHDLWASATP